jgi:N-formylglutamate amidohydrolase
MKPFFVSIPHSGEKVPPETPWLHGLPEPVLMRDVDRYVNRLYRPALELLQISWVETEWHRYVVDLNRFPDDVDQDSVQGSVNPSGKFARGFHWSITTFGERLMPKPMTYELHQQLVARYFEPFHAQMRARYSDLRGHWAHEIYHIDAHSMPSVGTKEHRDPGQARADIVVSDCEGKSCAPWFKDKVIECYSAVGFKVAYNWPYTGGRVTETYGKPAQGQHSIQVEMSRALYMNEDDKSYTDALARPVQEKLKRALTAVRDALPDIR